MKHWKLWLSLVVILGLAAGGGWLWWDQTIRYRPKTITVNQLEIARALERAGWVSARRGQQATAPGRTLYMVSFRDCPDCLRFEREVLPQLDRAGVETRIIMVARADSDAGVARSTPAERATVAELWVNRSWDLFQRWHAANAQTWTAAGIPAADGDTTRTAVVDAGRNMVEELTPMLRRNDINFAYPLLVWTTRDGEMRGCACESARTYRYVLRDLGA